MRDLFSSMVSRLCCRRLLAHEGGIAAVEFALILPILVVLWIGGVEVTQALSVDRRLNNLASSIGDLVARTDKNGLIESQVGDIFDMAPGAMYPYSDTTLKMRVSAVWVDDDGIAKVRWSQGDGMTQYADNHVVTSVVPSALRSAEGELIMAEVEYVYTPAVGYVITGGITLQDRMFFVPRVVDRVKLCDNDRQNCKS